MYFKNFKIIDEKLQCDINRDAAKIPVLSSRTFDEYEFLTDKEISSNHSRIIEQAKFTYSLLCKSFRKQIKTIGDQEIKQAGALKALKSDRNQELESVERLFPKKMRNIESKNEIDEIKNWEETIKLKYLKHKTNRYRNEFQQFETIRYFGDNIYTIKVNIDEAETDQNNPSEDMVKFITKTRPRLKEDKGKKEILKNTHMLFMKVENYFQKWNISNKSNS